MNGEQAPGEERNHCRLTSSDIPCLHGRVLPEHLTNLISFYDKMTHLVDEGKPVDVVYPNFSKAFDTVSHSILLEKLAAHGLEGHTLRWVKN